jgi:ABC-2 type transport system permease protein
MISLFWTISGEGLIKIAPPLVLFLSGLYIPLPLMPDWARAIAEALPFRGIIDIPIRLYTGITPLSAFWGQLGFQLLWTATLVYAGRQLLKNALRHVVIQGG